MNTSTTTVIEWAGITVFGIPAALAVPALMSTLAHYGVWDTLTHASLPVLAACLPLILWVRYTRHRPTRRAGMIAWTLTATILLASIALTPLWFWAVPSTGVLTAEAIRILTDTIQSRRRHPQPAPARTHLQHLAGVTR